MNEHKAPSIEAARKMGETGGPAVEAERLAFEAWIDDCGSEKGGTIRQAFGGVKNVP